MRSSLPVWITTTDWNCIHLVAILTPVSWWTAPSPCVLVRTSPRCCSDRLAALRVPPCRGQEGSRIQRLCHYAHYYPKVKSAPPFTININSSIYYFKITELEKTATATEGKISSLKYFNYQFFSINELKSNLKVLEKIYTTIKEDLQ